MPSFGPISRKDLIYFLHKAGFTGPYPGSNHQVMWKELKRIIIPNPHRGDVSIDLVKKILRQAGISREEWEKL